MNIYTLELNNDIKGVTERKEYIEHLIMKTPYPFGNVAVGICYDARRRYFYENIKEQTISLILFPHGSPSDPMKAVKEQTTVDYFCNAYLNAFDVPVVYGNSKGKLDFMLGRTGRMMAKAGFVLNGMSAIYSKRGNAISTNTSEIIGWSGDIIPKTQSNDLIFYGNDIIKGNWLFRKYVLQPDIRDGIHYYQKMKELNEENVDDKK